MNPVRNPRSSFVGGKDLILVIWQRWIPTSPRVVWKLMSWLFCCRNSVPPVKLLLPRLQAPPTSHFPSFITWCIQFLIHSQPACQPILHQLVWLILTLGGGEITLHLHSDLKKNVNRKTLITDFLLKKKWANLAPPIRTQGLVSSFLFCFSCFFYFLICALSLYRTITLLTCRKAW